MNNFLISLSLWANYWMFTGERWIKWFAWTNSWMLLQVERAWKMYFLHLILLLPKSNSLSLSLPLFVYFSSILVSVEAIARQVYLFCKLLFLERATYWDFKKMLWMVFHAHQNLSILLDVNIIHLFPDRFLNVCFSGKTEICLYQKNQNV